MGTVDSTTHEVLPAGVAEHLPAPPHPNAEGVSYVHRSAWMRLDKDDIGGEWGVVGGVSGHEGQADAVRLSGA